MKRHEWQRDGKGGAEEKFAPRNRAVSPAATEGRETLRNSLGVQEVPRLFTSQATAAKSRAHAEPDSSDSGTRDRWGAALPPGLREQMERALGADLGNVRVHDDAAAQASSEAINADAYTRGEEVFLGSEARGLDAEASRQLLAHEVVHVVQQRKAGVLSGKINEAGDTYEREANQVSHQALMGHRVSVGGAGAAPAVQRQISGGSITKRDSGNTATRSEVRQAILEYLQRAQAAQGGTFHLNQAIRTALLTLSNAGAPGVDADPQRAARSIAMEQVLSSGSIEPSSLATRAAQILPDPFDRTALQRLLKMAVTDSEKSAVERVKDLAEKNLKQPDAPTDQPPSPMKQQDEIIDKMRAARGLPQPKTIGPGSVDVLGLARTLRDLPSTIKPKPSPPPVAVPPSSEDLEQAIAKIPNDSLVPLEARGTAHAHDFAEVAQDVARDLSGKIALAQKKREELVVLRFPDAYNSVKDRSAMIDAVVKLVKAVRDASPNHGLPVKYIDVYFGDRLVTRNVGGGSEE